MKLLVINPSADLYGANRILVNTLEFLQLECEIILLLPSDGPLVQFLKERQLKVKIVTFDDIPTIGRSKLKGKGIFSLFGSTYRSFVFLKRLKKQYNIDYAYVNTQAELLSLKLCKWIGLPALLHVHEIVDHPRLPAKLINKASLKWADKIIAVSSPVRENLLAMGSVPRHSNKVRVVLNGIVDPLEKVEPTGMVKEPDQKIVISLIARIKPDKGIWFFLDAIAGLPAEVADKCMFNIVGGAPPFGAHLIGKLKDDLSVHKYGRLIQYREFMPDVSALQYSSDILVVPSLMRDPFPTTILEAMALGKPVIATNGGGAVQSVDHGNTGYLINPGDVSAFVNYLILLIQDGELRKTIGMQARRQYLEKFTMDVFRKNFLSTFNFLQHEKS